PWDLGKKGSRRAICASVNQKRSDMFTARFQTVKHAIRRKSMGPDPNICNLFKFLFRIGAIEKVVCDMSR
ncbi:hypothetical protein, partial [Shimia sp.]|uniref:hypothetical protein n=1 Tax=Shimia sp. TaxID=1954381 RepID=UPI0025F497C1